MARVKRKHRLRYYTINVKIRSNKREGRDAYVQMFEDLHKKKIMKKIGGEHAMIIRTMHRHYIGDDFMLVGHVTRFTAIDGDKWFNIQNLEIEEPNIPKHFLPNPKEEMYYFVPSAHRLAFKVNTTISLSVVVEFLKSALLEVIDRDEQVEVIVEQASDVFEKILNATSVRRITITISYTNSDITDGADKWLDDQLKISQVGKIKIEAKSDQNDDILIEKNDIINGAIALARSNGMAEANIVDSEDGQRKVVKTDLHPKFEIIEESLEENLLPGLFNKIMAKIRRDADNP